MRQLVEGGVDLGHDHVLLVGQGLGQLIPHGNELFAVTAPWSIEFDLENDKVIKNIVGNKNYAYNKIWPKSSFKKDQICKDNF